MLQNHSLGHHAERCRPTPPSWPQNHPQTTMKPEDGTGISFAVAHVPNLWIAHSSTVNLRGCTTELRSPLNATISPAQKRRMSASCEARRAAGKRCNHRELWQYPCPWCTSNLPVFLPSKDDGGMVRFHLQTHEMCMAEAHSIVSPTKYNLGFRNICQVHKKSWFSTREPPKI